jgi:hypothetical protein
MLTLGGVSSSGPGLLTETICLDIGTVAETGRKFGGGSVYASTGGRSTPLAGATLSGKILERMNSIYKKDVVARIWFITLFLYLSPLLLSGGDQSLNPARSTTIRTISTDEEEKIFSL